MIQDIDPRKYNNHYEEREITAEDRIFVFSEGKVLVRKQEMSLTYPCYRELKEQLKEVRYLFSIDEEYYFLGTGEKIDLDGYMWETIKIFRNPTYGYEAFAGITAHQLYEWYRDNRFCGKCATTLMHSKKERMLQCPACGKMLYPQIAPAVIVAVTNGDSLVLTRYADRDYKRYALIAGFTEIGETIEETVHREVMEEVGLKVKNLRFYKSQPWSFSGTLLFGFFAEVDGDTQIRMDTEELSVAEWVPADQVPCSDDEISLTREMMSLFHKQHQKQEP